jgi:hypothetical protein
MPTVLFTHGWRLFFYANERNEPPHIHEMNMSKKIHEVEIVQIDAIGLHLLVDGQLYRLAWEDCSAKLARATNQERSYIEVSPSGYGLHWPLLDEDLAITPLLQHAEIAQQETI